MPEGRPTRLIDSALDIERHVVGIASIHQIFAFTSSKSRPIVVLEGGTRHTGRVTAEQHLIRILIAKFYELGVLGIADVADVARLLGTIASEGCDNQDSLKEMKEYLDSFVSKMSSNNRPILSVIDGDIE